MKQKSRDTNDRPSQILTFAMATIPVSSGGLAVKHQALDAKGRRFDPSKKSKVSRD